MKDDNLFQEKLKSITKLNPLKKSGNMKNFNIVVVVNWYGGENYKKRLDMVILLILFVLNVINLYWLEIGENYQ
jgi:hypothetical protein